MARVTGIGGVFFKCKGDPKALAAWYETHLGLRLERWGGAVLRWPDDTADDKGLTVWNVASPDSQWFDAPLMINYRVDDLDQLLANLRAAGVVILSGPEAHENGQFAWIVDAEGNKVELWQPMRWDAKNKAH